MKFINHESQTFAFYFDFKGFYAESSWKYSLNANFTHILRVNPQLSKLIGIETIKDFSKLLFRQNFLLPYIIDLNKK